MEHTACETRVLHRLALPRVFDSGTDPAERRLGLFVDCETTGADWARDVVVELALLPFTYTEDGRMAEVLADEAQVHLRDPGRALATGAGDDARGRHIDAAAAGALMERADLVVAHNARFDRPFIERVVPAARERPWTCSRLEVPWRAAGAPSDALHCLLCHYGVFAGRRHRALADCEAGVWLLGQRLPGAGRGVLAVLPEDAEPVAENLLPSWRAEPGRDYEVFLTTVNGLIRYRLHDIVRCTGWFHRSPRLRFRSKSAFLLKVTSTTVPEDDVARLLRDIGYRGADDLLIGPHPSRSAFTMYVREGSDAARLAGALDDALREYTSAYDLERNKRVLGPVETITVPASHWMWDYRTRGQAKSRYVLPTAPRDLEPATRDAGPG